MTRLLLFADPRSPASLALVGAALEAAERHPSRQRGGRAGIEVVGVVDGAPRPADPLVRTLAARAARRVLDPSAARPSGPLRPPVALIVPPDRDVNHPAFVADVRERLRPDAAVNFLSTQLFRDDLLAALRAPANYHDGLLPRYRGIGATAWSVYDGAAQSGFSFHRMTRGLDDGPVLLQDAVDVPLGATSGAVGRTKTRLAAARMGEVMTMIAAGDPGTAQQGEPTVFTQADRRAAQRVGDPARLSFGELQRRLRAFEILGLDLDGGRWEVTALRRARRPGRLVFATADGVAAEPHRCVHLPVPLYRAYRPLRRR